jgi:hypothetical protein
MFWEAMAHNLCLERDSNHVQKVGTLGGWSDPSTTASALFDFVRSGRGFDSALNTGARPFFGFPKPEQNGINSVGKSNCQNHKG